MIRVNKQGISDLSMSNTCTAFVPVGTNYCNMLDMVRYDGQLCRFPAPLFGTDRETLADPLAEACDLMKPSLGDVRLRLLGHLFRNPLAQSVPSSGQGRLGEQHPRM